MAQNNATEGAQAANPVLTAEERARRVWDALRRDEAVGPDAYGRELGEGYIATAIREAEAAAFTRGLEAAAEMLEKAAENALLVARVNGAITAQGVAFSWLDQARWIRREAAAGGQPGEGEEQS